MEKKKIYTIVFALVFALCAVGFIWSWWVTREIRKNTEGALNQSQQVEITNLVLTETKDGKKYWELYAKTGDYDSANGTVILKEIVGNFYDKKEQVVLSFQSPQGSYLESEKIITLRGETLIVAKDGSSITANKFVWKGQDEDIVASDNVVINRNNELITQSEQAVFNSELTYFKIKGKAKSNIFEKMPEVLEVKK